MKIKGRKLEGPRKKIVPIIRDEADGGNLYFVVQGVVDLQPFFDVCPSPTPPKMIKPGGVKVDNIEDPGYKASLDQWWLKRSHWITLQSLAATEGLEWETVNLMEPDTYKNWNTELQSAGLVDAEISRVLTAIMEVNGLNETLVEEARQSFLTIQAAQESGQSSPSADPLNGQSGKAASESESVRQDSKT